MPVIVQLAANMAAAAWRLAWDVSRKSFINSSHPTAARSVTPKNPSN